MAAKLPNMFLNICKRGFSKNANISAREIKIPLPHGHLAAKDWGLPDGKPVLALHGWQDNAGTFDTLIPKLDPSLHIIAIDFPGHGLSSHKPTGTHYHFMEALIDIKYALEYLTWKNVNILGHSLGANLGLFYASVFPDEVETIVSIDIIKPLTVSPEKQPDVTRKSIKQMMTFINKRNIQPPVYTYEQAVLRLLEGMSDSITEESAHILLKRGAQQMDGNVTFSRDIRVQAGCLQTMDLTVCKAYLRRIKSNLMIIKAKDGLDLDEQDVYQEFIDMYRQNCHNFQYVEVEGAHHVHLNHPERVADFINVFFKTVSDS